MPAQISYKILLIGYKVATIRKVTAEIIEIMIICEK